MRTPLDLLHASTSTDACSPRWRCPCAATASRGSPTSSSPRSRSFPYWWRSTTTAGWPHDVAPWTHIGFQEKSIGHPALRTRDHGRTSGQLCLCLDHGYTNSSCWAYQVSGWIHAVAKDQDSNMTFLD